jgi:hypothetical protein
MAKFRVKESDTKYAHLKKVYNENQEEVKIAEPVIDQKVEFKKETINVSKKRLLIDLGVVAGLFVIGLAGYLISKIG